MIWDTEEAMEEYLWILANILLVIFAKNEIFF